MRRLGFLVLAWLLLSGQAPLLGLPPGALLSRGAIDPPASISYVGPGDAVSGAVAFFGLRAYNLAYATSHGKMLAVTLTTNSHTCDILSASSGTLGNTANCSTGGDNGESAAAFCGSSCTISTFYDQTGGGYDVTQQGTVATLTFNGVNLLPVATFPGGATNYYLVSKTLTAAEPYTYAAVADRLTVSGTDEDFLIGASSSANGLDLIWSSVSANIINALDSSNDCASLAQIPDTQFHAFTIAMEGASAVYTDGAKSFSCTFTKGLNGLFEIGYENHMKFAEAGVWPSGLTTTQQAALVNNQVPYWGWMVDCYLDFQIFGAGQYFLWNDDFNKASLVNGTDFTSSLVPANAASLNTNVTITWSWPATVSPGGVYGIAGISYGSTTGTATLTTVTSKQLSAINTIGAAYSTSISGSTSNFDGIIDAFLSSAVNGGGSQQEIAIYFHAPAFVQSFIGGLPNQTTFTDSQGRVWVVGYQAGSGDIIGFYPQNGSDILSGTIDVLAMYKFVATTLGQITTSWYFNALMFGNEPQADAGSMVISSFNMTYN